MHDGRRHSVDIPISKTLIALRRVRSLRDPSTISTSKFPSSVDNVKWETNSGNEISLQFMNSCEEGVSDNYGILKSNNLSSYKQSDDYMDDFDLNRGFGISKLFSEWEGIVDAPIRTKQVEKLDSCDPHQEKGHKQESLNEKYRKSILEGVDSYNESVVRSSQLNKIDQTTFIQKSEYEDPVKSSPSLSDALSNRSSLFFNDKVGVLDHGQDGCAISCCWTRTPRFRQSNLASNTEEHPLLSPSVDETSLYRQRSNMKNIGNEITPYSETPRSLSQKFRPKNFHDLVGQNVVAKSLLGAISKGRITSFYLFHGPRGTGKTSASRIFAAALNCLTLDDNKPCGSCRECVLFFSGRSRDVKEVDSMRISKIERVRSLIKNAVVPPVSSQFKVFIIDECHMLKGDTWATLLSSLENLSQNVVFVMITPDLDKLPRSVVSRSQRYYFPKIKDADISSRLERICLEDTLEFDQIALDFIAAKSNGSLRDAEMMLEQLSLLGKKITLALARELIGIVSDEELLDLLNLALSSDASNTVIRARELMKSRIDPMQLISQLANLIMDILAGKCEESTSEVRTRFSCCHTSEADLQKLRHALKLLSETEKQLRISKNQTTWLTVALLQLSSIESSSQDGHESKFCLRSVKDGDDDFCKTYTGENLRHLFPCSCDGNKSHKLGFSNDCQGTLESIWKRVVELCQSSSLKNFLRKCGKLSGLSVNQGLAVAELEFSHPKHVATAEKSWKLIASSLQSLLGCNVEIRINLGFPPSNSTHAKVRKPSFSLFSCSRRLKQKFQKSIEYGSDSDFSDYTSQKHIIRETPILTCSSDVVRKLRNSDGNAVSMRTTSSWRSFQDDMPKTHALLINSSKLEGNNCKCQFLERESQLNCFPRTLRLHKKRSSEMSQMICCIEQQKLQHEVAMSDTAKTSQTCVSASSPCVFCNSSNHYIESYRNENGVSRIPLLLRSLINLTSTTELEQMYTLLEMPTLPNKLKGVPIAFTEKSSYITAITCHRLYLSGVII